MSKKVTNTSEDEFKVNFQKFKEIFPQFVKEGEIDFDNLQKFFKEQNVLADKEKYGLSWAGRNDAFRAIKTTSSGTLAPVIDESKNWDTTENLFIEGDNLEVLKLLQKNYREKIKMIYIDPPYNTGKDFVYKDNFTESVSDYYEKTGQTKDGIKMSVNTEKNGRFHSDWLTMMYPRLFLARNLLKEDGVIFISIDDNEVANLRLICDEIFGEENFISTIHWRKVEGKPGQAGQIGKVVEFLLAYSKKQECVSLGKLPLSERAKKEYRYNDDRGQFRRGQIFYPERGSYKFSVNTPYRTILDGNFTVDEEEFKDLDSQQLIYWAEKGEHTPYLKVYLSESLERSATNDWTEESGSNQGGVKEFKALFNGLNIFDNPKPTRLLKKILSFSSVSNNEIVLDFFAGSGTTAHAVMDLNAEDGGNRKFICVQIPEATEEESEAYKAGYNNIAGITKERIRRAGEKIKKELKEKKPELGLEKETIIDPEKLDIGFKVYKLKNSNFRRWKVITEEVPEEEILKQSKLIVDKPLLDGYDEMEVVQEVLLKEGFSLRTKIEKEKIKAGKSFEMYFVTDLESDKKAYITFEEDLLKLDILELLKTVPKESLFVCFDSALDDNLKVNINRSLNLKVI